jgi:hypothetical protein
MKGTPTTFSGKPKQSKLKHVEPLIPMLGYGVKSQRRVSPGWKRKPSLRSKIRNKFGV